MSIYVMTLGELAKKRGEPVGDFVKKVQSVGFDAGSHAKKLTQDDLNVLIGLLDGNVQNNNQTMKQESAKRIITNPNVLMLKTKNNTNVIAFVDASLNEDGTIKVEVLESREETSMGETLLEFRKQLGLKLGVN